MQQLLTSKLKGQASRQSAQTNTFDLRAARAARSHRRGTVRQAVGAHDWDDALDLARNSNTAKTSTHNDPNVQAGYREVARRRAEENDAEQD